jgi:Ribbon-helix-helix protein, copG family
MHGCVRTTLTIDDDVAAILTRLRKSRGVPLRDLVNEALRRGLHDMKQKSKEKRGFRTQTVNLGRLKVGSIDNIAEVLSFAEGDAFK